MLQLKDFMPVNFLKKEKYTGSCKGMRFRMEKFEKEGERKLLSSESASGRNRTALTARQRKKSNF